MNKIQCRNNLPACKRLIEFLCHNSILKNIDINIKLAAVLSQDLSIYSNLYLCHTVHSLLLLNNNLTLSVA